MGLFCKRALQKRLYSAKATNNSTLGVLYFRCSVHWMSVVCVCVCLCISSLRVYQLCPLSINNCALRFLVIKYQFCVCASLSVYEPLHVYQLYPLLVSIKIFVLSVLVLEYQLCVSVSMSVCVPLRVYQLYLLLVCVNNFALSVLVIEYQLCVCVCVCACSTLSAPAISTIGLH